MKNIYAPALSGEQPLNSSNNSNNELILQIQVYQPQT